MHTLFKKLNFSFKPLIATHNLLSSHYRIPLTLLNPELTNLLLSYDIKINFAECFNRQPGGEIPIHTDYSENGECVKINWIYGGQGSTMNWFHPKENMTGTQRKTSVNTSYVLFTPDEVNTIAVLETVPEVPFLLQAGVPHTVFNKVEHRSCISLLLYDMDNKHLTMTEALKRLEKHIVT